MNIDIANFVTVILIAAFISVMFILITAILSLRQQTRELSKVNIQRSELAMKRRESEDFQDELQQLTDRLKRISSMDNLFFNSMISLTAQLNPEEIVKQVTELLFGFLNAQQLAVFLVDDRGRRLSVKGMIPF